MLGERLGERYLGGVGMGLKVEVFRGVDIVKGV